MFSKKVIQVFITILTLASATAIFAAQEKQPVNILTWWGYIDGASSSIKTIEKECNVEISYDEYYSNDDFIEKVSQTDTSYDIVIFSQTVLNSVKSKLGRKNSNLHTLSNNYYPLFKERYLKTKLPNNMVYFAISLTGFLYNPNNITISGDDTIEKIFQDAQSNIIVVIDDGLEANYLIKSLLKENKENAKNSRDLYYYSTWEIFNKLFQGKHVFITNKLDSIIKDKNFSFGFVWSGEAIELISKENNNLEFLVHPKLSYLSTDILAQINEKLATTCVAKKLSGKKFLDDLQNKSFYFSPYMLKPKGNNKYFIDLYVSTIKELPNLPWVDSMTKENIDQVKYNWDYVKYKQELSNEPL